MTSSLSFRISVALVAILILAAGLWLLKHSDNGHPVNIKCILWKAGIYKMGVNIAVGSVLVYLEVVICVGVLRLTPLATATA